MTTNFCSLVHDFLPRSFTSRASPGLVRNSIGMFIGHLSIGHFSVECESPCPCTCPSERHVLCVCVAQEYLRYAITLTSQKKKCHVWRRCLRPMMIVDVILLLSICASCQTWVSPLPPSPLGYVPLLACPSSHMRTSGMENAFLTSFFFRFLCRG